MGTKIETGGPAFPRTGYYPDTSNCKGDIDALRERLGACTDPNPGMTLRDYFAAKALNGMLSDQRKGSFVDGNDATLLASVAYKMADAMLAARKAVRS